MRRLKFAALSILFLMVTLSSYSQNFNGNIYTITCSMSGKCLDVTGSGSENGTKVILYNCHGGPNQQWRMESSTNGTYVLYCMANGKCLDADANNMNNGTKIQVWDFGGGENQKWRLEPVGNGKYYIRSAANNKCLDGDPSSMNTNYTRMQIWDLNGGDNQQWEFHPVGNSAVSAAQQSTLDASTAAELEKAKAAAAKASAPAPAPAPAQSPAAPAQAPATAAQVPVVLPSQYVWRELKFDFGVPGNISVVSWPIMKGDLASTATLFFASGQDGQVFESRAIKIRQTPIITAQLAMPGQFRLFEGEYESKIIGVTLTGEIYKISKTKLFNYTCTKIEEAGWKDYTYNRAAIWGDNALYLMPARTRFPDESLRLMKIVGSNSKSEPLYGLDLNNNVLSIDDVKMTKSIIGNDVIDICYDKSGYWQTKGLYAIKTDNKLYKYDSASHAWQLDTRAGDATFTKFICKNALIVQNANGQIYCLEATSY